MFAAYDALLWMPCFIAMRSRLLLGRRASSYPSISSVRNKSLIVAERFLRNRPKRGQVSPCLRNTSEVSRFDVSTSLRRLFFIAQGGRRSLSMAVRELTLLETHIKNFNSCFLSLFVALYFTHHEDQTFSRNHGFLEKWQESFSII